MKKRVMILGVMMILISLWALPAPVAGAIELTFSAYASSYLDSINKNTYYPENAFDGDLDTCWCEGVKGSGIGESIWIRSSENVLMKGFRIWNGYQKSKETYYNNNRVKQLGIYADGVKLGSWELSDSYSEDEDNVEYDILDEYVVASRIEFVIEDVYNGAKYDDTCIANIMVLID